MPDVTVKVPFVKQQNASFCGPAVLQMILAGGGARRPAGRGTWQERLWADVQAETRARRPKGAKAGGAGNVGCTPWKKQKCEKCAGQWVCWCTTPQAIARVLNRRAPATQMKVHRHTTEAAVTARLVAGIDAEVAGIALVRGWFHWVAVRGYLERPKGSTRRAQKIGNKSVTAIYIRDPQRKAALTAISMNTWFSDYLQVVPCGQFKNRYVVVATTKRSR